MTENFKLSGRNRLPLPLAKQRASVSRKDDQLYFSRWDEQMEGQIYQEEVVVRRYPDGSILDVIPGAWMEMPDGQIWLLR